MSTHVRSSLWFMIIQNLHHYYRSLGGWTFEFDDYYQLNFTGSLDNPAVQLMANIIDPLGMTTIIDSISIMPSQFPILYVYTIKFI